LGILFCCSQTKCPSVCSPSPHSHSAVDTKLNLLKLALKLEWPALTNFNEWAYLYQNEKKMLSLNWTLLSSKESGISWLLPQTKYRNITQMSLCLWIRENQQWSSQGLRAVLFILLQRDICKTAAEDTAAFLPEPIKSRRGGAIFPVSFSC
jgi:hypothetical protein